jgi:glucosyl-dolichyl phosphate glucuronosyltransferase
VSPTPTISVTIATYERYELLGGAIESLLKQDLDAADYEIIVVDNSRDLDAAAKFGKRYEGIENVRYLLETTRGNAHAYNKGASLSRGRIFALIDDDGIAARDWMRQLIAAFDAYGGRAGCVGGRIVPRWTTPRPDWLPDELLGYLSIVDWGAAMRELGPDEWLAGCNLAFDLEVLRAAGGFNSALGRKGSEAILLSNTEIYAYERVRQLGKAVVYAPAAVVEHIIDPSRTTQEWMRRRVAWQVISDYIKDEGPTTSKLSDALARARHALGASAPAGDATAFLREHDAIKDLMLSLLSGKAGLNRSPMRIESSTFAARLRKFFGGAS